MYLSRIRLHPSLESTQLTHLLQDRRDYGLHRLFWDLFEGQKRQFLYRMELANEQRLPPGRRKADPVYYVLSADKPRQDSPLFQVEPQEYRPQLEVGDRLAFKLRVNAVVTRDGKRHDIVMDAQRSWLQKELKALELSSEGGKHACKQRLLDHADDQCVSEWKREIADGPFCQQLEQRLGRIDLLEWALKTSIEQAIHHWWHRQGVRFGFEVPTDDTALQAVSYQKHHLPEKHRQAGFSSLDLSGEVIVSNVDCFNRLLFEGTGPAKAFGCGLIMVRRV